MSENATARTEPIYLTYDEALTVIAPKGRVHCMMQSSFGFIGADWQRRSVLREFKNATAIEIGGPACRAAGHGLVVHGKDGKLYFLQADESKLSEFEKAKM